MSCPAANHEPCVGIFTCSESILILSHISKKTIYVRQTQPASRRVASALCVPCALTIRRTFFLIPCAWCLPTPLSPLPCIQRACCGCPPSGHPPHPFPLLLLSSDGIQRTDPQFPVPGPPAPYLLPPATYIRPVASEIVWLLSARTPSSHFLAFPTSAPLIEISRSSFYFFSQP